MKSAVILQQIQHEAEPPQLTKLPAPRRPHLLLALYALVAQELWQPRRKQRAVRLLVSRQAVLTWARPDSPSGKSTQVQQLWTFQGRWVGPEQQRQTRVAAASLHSCGKADISRRRRGESGAVPEAASTRQA